MIKTVPYIKNLKDDLKQIPDTGRPPDVVDLQ